jgi:hypothetical protein
MCQCALAIQVATRRQSRPEHRTEWIRVRQSPQRRPQQVGRGPSATFHAKRSVERKALATVVRTLHSGARIDQTTRD